MCVCVSHFGVMSFLFTLTKSNKMTHQMTANLEMTNIYGKQITKNDKINVLRILSLCHKESHNLI